MGARGRGRGQEVAVPETNAPEASFVGKKMFLKFNYDIFWFSKDCFTKKNIGTALEEAIGAKNHYERHRGGPDDKKWVYFPQSSGPKKC